MINYSNLFITMFLVQDEVALKVKRAKVWLCCTVAIVQVPLSGPNTFTSSLLSYPSTEGNCMFAISLQRTWHPLEPLLCQLNQPLSYMAASCNSYWFHPDCYLSWARKRTSSWATCCMPNMSSQLCWVLEMTKSHPLIDEVESLLSFIHTNN